MAITFQDDQRPTSVGGPEQVDMLYLHIEVNGVPYMLTVYADADWNVVVERIRKALATLNQQIDSNMWREGE